MTLVQAWPSPWAARWSWIFGAGIADAARTQPWEEDTIVNVYSTTKTMTALVALVLADRGELDLDAPVARYWPEFAQNGKESVRVSHPAGPTRRACSGLDERIAVDVLYDWDETCDRLARQAPWWEPGASSGYHAITQGYLVGEVVRRIRGKSLGSVFREEIGNAARRGLSHRPGCVATRSGRPVDPPRCATVGGRA